MTSIDNYEELIFFLSGLNDGIKESQCMDAYEKIKPILDEMLGLPPSLIQLRKIALIMHDREITSQYLNDESIKKKFGWNVDDLDELDALLLELEAIDILKWRGYSIERRWKVSV